MFLAWVCIYQKIHNERNQNVSLTYHITQTENGLVWQMFTHTHTHANTHTHKRMHAHTHTKKMKLMANGTLLYVNVYFTWGHILHSPCYYDQIFNSIKY